MLEMFGVKQLVIFLKVVAFSSFSNEWLVVKMSDVTACNGRIDDMTSDSWSNGPGCLVGRPWGWTTQHRHGPLALRKVSARVTDSTTRIAGNSRPAVVSVDRENPFGHHVRGGRRPYSSDPRWLAADIESLHRLPVSGDFSFRQEQTRARQAWFGQRPLELRSHNQNIPTRTNTHMGERYLHENKARYYLQFLDIETLFVFCVSSRYWILNLRPLYTDRHKIKQ